MFLNCWFHEIFLMRVNFLFYHSVLIHWEFIFSLIRRPAAKLELCLPIELRMFLLKGLAKGKKVCLKRPLIHAEFCKVQYYIVHKLWGKNGLFLANSNLECSYLQNCQILHFLTKYYSKMLCKFCTSSVLLYVEIFVFQILREVKIFPIS